MAVLLHDRPEAAGKKQREALRLPRTSAVVALFAFSSRMDRDSMRLFARTHGDEVRVAAIASTGQEVLELLHGGLRPQVLVLDALLTKPSVTQVLQEISTMQPDPEPAVLVLVPVPEETAARKALGLFAQYRIMLRPYGMKNLFDEIYRMGATDDEHRLYHLRRCCEDVLDDFGARSTLNGYRYAERMLLYALYAERPQKIGDLQQYVASEENIEIGTVTSALNRMSAGMSKRGAEPYRGLCLRCGRRKTAYSPTGSCLRDCSRSCAADWNRLYKLGKKAFSMDRRNEDTALLALRGGLRGRFRRSFDSMENAFEVLQDRLQHAVNPAERAELMPLLEELQTQLICLRRLGDQASDAATAALLHGTCVPQPIDLLGQLREFCSILQEEAAQYALPFTVTLQADGLDVLPTTGDVSLLNGLLTNLVSNTLAADRAAHIMLLCTPGRLCYRDNGPGLPPDAAALLTEGQWSERLLHAGGLGLPLVAAYTSAMGWALTVGEGPGMSLQFTLPAAPPLDGMVLTSPTERLADRQNRRRLIRRELAVLVADTSIQ